MSNETMRIPISKRIADEFLSSLQDTFESTNDVEADDLYLSSNARNGVPISYTQSLEPFVGHTRGYNRPAERVYLDTDNFVLRAIREALIDAGEWGSGARVFLTETSAYYDDDGEEKTLVRWRWPGADLEERVANLGR